MSATIIDEINSRLPQAVTDLTSQEGAGPSVTLSWQAPQAAMTSEVLGYAVQQSADSGRTWTTAIGSFGTDNLSFSTAPFAPEASVYYYRVAARSAAGIGAFSEPVAAPVAEGVYVSGRVVTEHAAPGTVVGKLLGISGSLAGSVSYALVQGEGSTDNALFAITDGNLVVGGSIDFETGTTRSVRLRAFGSGGGMVETAIAISVTNVNEAPTAVSLANVTLNLPENTNTASRVKVADIVVTDDALGSETITLSGADAAAFEVDGTVLYLTAGTSLNYEVRASYAVTVNVRDTAIVGSATLMTDYALAITDVNEPPAAVGFTNATSSLPENTVTTSRIKLGDIVVTDDALGSVVLGLSGADAGAFEVDGTSLYLKAGTSLNYETKPSYEVTVWASDPALPTSTSATAAFPLFVTDVNEAPTEVSLTNTNTTLPENTSTASRLKVADVAVTDDAMGAETITLSGADADSFEVDGTALYLKAGVSLNYEAKASYALTVRVRDASLPGSTTLTADYVLAIINVNEPPTAILLSNDSIAELQPSGTLVGTLSATDPDAGDSFSYMLVSGIGSDDNVAFSISGSRLVSTQVFNFETRSTYRIRVRATDAGGRTVDQVVTIAVTDVNEAPAGIALANRLKSISSTRDTSVRLKVADVVVSDDAIGTNRIAITGPDAGLFEADSGGLYLRPGAVLDPTTNPSFEIWMRVYDTTAIGVPANTPLMAFYSPDSGNLRLENTASTSLAIQSTTIESPTKRLDGAVASTPSGAAFVTSNASTSGPAGQYSRLSFANVGSPTVTLSPGEAWDFGHVASKGMTQAELVAAFVTASDDGPASTPGAFLYSLIVNGAGTPLNIGRIAESHGVGFTLEVVAVPTFTSQDVVSTGVGQTATDSTPRSGEVQIVKRGAGTLILDGTSTSTGGAVIEAGEVIVRNLTALGSGGLEIRPGAKVTFDIGTAKVALAALLLDDGATIEVGLGGLRIASGGVTADRVRELLIQGRNGGRWDGAGIASASAQQGSSRAVGYRLLASGDIHIGWAAPGDANLDGTIDVRDLNLLVANSRYGVTGGTTGWWQGDLNYNGVFDTSDLNMLINAALFGQGSYYPQASGSAVIDGGIAPVMNFRLTATSAEENPATANAAVSVEPSHEVASAVGATLQPAEEVPAEAAPGVIEPGDSAVSPVMIPASTEALTVGAAAIESPVADWAPELPMEVAVSIEAEQSFVGTHQQEEIVVDTRVDAETTTGGDTDLFPAFEPVVGEIVLEVAVEHPADDSMNDDSMNMVPAAAQEPTETVAVSVEDKPRADEAVVGLFVLEVGTEDWMADVRADLPAVAAAAAVAVIATPDSPHEAWTKAEGLVREKAVGTRQGAMADVWRSLAALGDGHPQGNDGTARAGFKGQRRRGIAESVWKAL
jgi:autotransporter-associated beta strand protein